ENRQIVPFVIGRGHDDDVERLVPVPGSEGPWSDLVFQHSTVLRGSNTRSGPNSDGIVPQPGRARRRPDHPRGRGPPSVRSAEICSETSPTRKTTTENSMRSTAPLGIREWTATFHTP